MDGQSAKVHTQPTAAADIQFTGVSAYGWTPLGEALKLAKGLIEDKEKTPSRAYRPLVILVTDGMPTDDWKRPLERLQKLPWGKKAVMIAIAIGRNADKSVLEAFTGNPETVLSAEIRETLVHLIKWASTAAAAVSQPASVAADELPDGQNYQLVPPPAIEETQLDTAAEPESAEDVW